MPAPDRLKRRLMRALVEDNVEDLQGRPRGFYRRRRARLHSWLVRGAIALAGGVFLTGAYLAVGAARPSPSSERALPPAPRSRPAPGTSAASSVAYAMPRPVGPSVMPLAVKTVMLDPGHGGRDQGTVATYGLLEKDLTYDISYRLKGLLESDGFRVEMTREADETVSLEERARRANRAAADVFVSVHVNWIPNRLARGVETYFLGPTNDPFLTRLAATENRDSGFSLADFRSLMERMYADVRQQQSRHLAEALQASLYTTLHGEDAAVSDRGVKTAPFVVLIATEMPAALAEVSCLSNEAEARRLARPRYRQDIARALEDGIRAFAHTVNGASDTGEKGHTR